VGWARATPVSIWLSLSGEKTPASIFSGRLRLHTVARKKSGILMPHRIDVYASRDNEAWAHVHGVQFDAAKFKDERDHWLEADVVWVQQHLLLVIHANGEYLFIDEITWEDQPQPQVAKERQSI